MARRRFAVAVIGVGLSACGLGQTHKVEKPEAVVRAVGVYEWTGDLTKPKASRLIPVSLYINGELEDAAIYQPRPIPFALQPGNAYELQQAGVAKGLVELSSAGKLNSESGGFDDGWFGYGTYQSPAEERAAKLKEARRITPITTGKDDEQYGKGGGKDDDSKKADPDRPTLRRRSSAGKTEKKPDPSVPDTTTAGTPADDPDRPVLKKRGQKDTATGPADTSGNKVVATESLNDDPNRPNLHRGKPTGGGQKADGEAMTKLSGLPQELHQMVAVSDAANRGEHDFVRPWEDEAEHKAVLGKMQALAAAKLATMAPDEVTIGIASPAKAAATPTTPAARRRAALAAAAAKRKAAAAHGPVLLDEDLRGFLLSYGGAPTFVYTAHTAGTGAALRYVTVVAQRDTFGELQVAFSSVTDAAHLDRTPWMRLVGVVDAEASNRASLLFEMREQGARQFALYRVLGARSEAVFTTGTTQ